MIRNAHASLAAFLRRSFLTGLLVLVPSILTFWICYAAFDWVDDRLINLLHGLPIEPYRGTGFVLGFAAVLGIGAFANNFLGKRIVDFYEAVLHRLPLVNQLFPALRQVSGLIFREDRTAFEKVVLIEYPRKDCYVLGFLSEAAPSVLSQRAGHERLLSVFVPTTPNPTSGFLLLIPEPEVMVLDMTPEQGLKMIVSGGLIKPEDVTQYTREAILDWGLFNYMWEILPWSVSVFFLTVGICWLARIPEWPWARENTLHERLTDGAFTGLMYAFGGIAATLAHIALQTGSGLSTQARILEDSGAAAGVFFSSFRMMSFVIGFAIGAIIIREVRQIAHTQLIAASGAGASREPARPDFAAVGAQVAASDAAPASGQALVRTD